MFQKLPIKIEEMPMSIALAKDGNETKNVRLEFKPFAVRLDQTFTSEFRCSIKGGLYWERRILRSWNNCSFTIYRPSRGECDLFNTVRAHRFQNIEGSYRILLEIFGWMLQAKADIRVRGKMKNAVTAVHGGREFRQIENVPLNELKAEV